MKKILSVLLAIIMVVSTVSICFADAVSSGIYPTIIVAGYSSSSLYNTDADGNISKIWGVDMDRIMALVLKNIARIGRGLGELAFGKPETVADIVGQAIVDMYGVMAYDENGNSINNIDTFSHSAAETQFSYLKKEVNGEHMHEAYIMSSVCDIYEEKFGVQDGNDYIFSFQTDFRQNIVDCAADLDRYIDDVREFTGAKKVNIFAVSHGGEVTATYLSLFGTEKNSVNNAVLTVPAIGGAALASDLMSENIVFDEETLFRFIENGMMLEQDIDWLVRANQFGILDDVCNLIMHKYAKQVVGYWGSIWDFISPDYYDMLKQQLPEATLKSEMIAKSDRFHHEIYPKLTDSFKACENAGINIYIVAGCGEPSVTGLQQLSDGIVTVKSATGASCAPYGKRFADGYKQIASVCSESSHNHLSPEMTIDASTGYTPDTTWFINGLFHGMTWNDSYTKELCSFLLFSDESQNVYSDAKFPQFKYSTNRCHAVVGSFNNSVEGYIASNDNEFIVTNISRKYTLKLLGINCIGADLTFDLSKPVYLKPGESVSIKVNGKLPAIGLTTADISIIYKHIGSPTPYGVRTLVFTVENGDSPDYGGGFDNANRPSDFDGALNENMRQLLEKTGIYDVLKMIFDLLSAVLKMFGKVC